MEIETSIEVVANYLLFNLKMSPKKLQKLLFLSYGYFLVSFNKELFENLFEGWIHGPVDPSIYYKYRFAGVYNVYRLKFNENLTTDAILVLEYIIKKYGRMSAAELEEYTHSFTPWIESRNGLLKGEIKNRKIKTLSIYNYFNNNNLKLYDIIT